MFPWAVSDLAQWWRNNPFPTLGPGASTTLWLSHQALGIASGLRAVHQSLGSPSTSQSGDVGRHGDIKPGNILWFPSSDDPVMGTWKIADFGLSAVESSPSFPGSNRLGCTPAYRAPEYDMPEREVGMSYDIWSLGCVLLECLTWSLVGLDGIKELEIRRSETAENGKKDNAFWEMVEAPRMDLALPLSNQAALKAVVSKWMDSLKASGREQSSAVFAYIEDLSSVIGKKMLVPEETQRSSSSEIVTELQKMHDKFLEQANVAAPQAASMPESETVEDQLAALINSPMQDVPALSLGEYTGEASIPADILDELALAAPCPDMISSWNGDKLHHTEPGAMNLDVPMSTDWPTINYTEPSTFQSGAFVHNHTEPIQQTVPSCGGLSSNTTRGSKRWLDIDEAPKESRTKQRRLEPETQPCKALKASSANKKSKVAQACGGPSNHSSPGSTALRFSCPFHKYDPQTFGIHDPRWRTCVGPGWTTMHRVKEHIDRKHTVQSNTCSRCLTAFPGPLELSQHQKADTPCKVNHENKFLVTDAQRALMRKRPRGRSEVGAWNDMYRIIFGLSESDAVPWPYHETAASPEESLPTVASQPSTTSLEDFDNYLTQSVMPGADAETMAKIQGYLDLAKQFRQVNSGSASQTANETVLSSVPSLMSDGFSYMTHSQLSEDSLMEMPAMDFSSSLGQDLGNAMKTSGPALNLLDAWSPSCLTKEEEELSRMLFCDPGSQHAEDDWLQSIS
jgi:serine/threonine protein kinase